VAPGKSQFAGRGLFLYLFGTRANQEAYNLCEEKSMKRGVLVLTVLTMVIAFLGGCKVQVNKSNDGEEHNVKIATPFGAIAVNQNQTSPGELGLPAYPGAVQDMTGEGTKSAKVDLGFGSWKLRVKVAHYTTTDRQDQVITFYRQALSEYGSVIECEGNKPVGKPASTSEGLTCDQSDSRAGDHGDALQLKAGSPHHQHLVVLKGGSNPPTQFTLIALDLPHGFDNAQKGTN
jgi:hypothetical protein